MAGARNPPARLTLFLSYSREDETRVRALAAELRPPLEVWLDRSELHSGERFPERIQRAIAQECAFALVLLGRAALNSEWVQRELGWALAREAELGPSIPFVLPILLEPVLESPNFPAALRDRHCLTWFEGASSQSLASTLSDTIFALIATHFVTTRPSGARAFLERFEADLLRYKELAFLMQATLRDSVALLAHNPTRHESFTQAVKDYAEFAPAFISRLPEYQNAVTSRWGVNLGEDCRALCRFVEEELYRGQVFALNQVRGDVNHASKSEVDDATLKAMDRRKDRALKTVQATLDELTERTGALLGKLRREL